MSATVTAQPKPRRQNRRRCTKAKPPSAAPMKTADISKLIDSKITESIRTAQFGVEGAKYIEMVSNPFGSEVNGGAGEVATQVPDPDHTRTVCLTCTGSYTFTGATSTSCVAVLQGPHGAMAVDDFEISYGNNPETRTDVPTNSVGTLCTQAVQLLAILTAPLKFRITAAALRVNATSSADDTAGVIHASQATHNPRSAVGTRLAYSYSTDQKESDSYDLRGTIKAGCTVRKRITGKSLTYQTAIPADYSGATAYVYDDMPCLILTGMSATTIVKFEYVYHLEAAVGTNSCIPAHMSPTEPEFSMILATVEKLPLSAAGHSFKSFLQKIGKGAKKALNFVWNNRDEIAGAATSVATLFSL